MNSNDIDLRLLYGLPIKVDNGMSVHSPKIKTIVEIGESTYQELLSIILLDKDGFGMEDSDGIDNFEVIYAYCNLDSAFKESFLKSISLFMREQAFIGSQDELPLFYFGNINEKRWITQFNFSLIQEMVRKANFIKKKEKEAYNPANDLAKEFIKELEEIEASRPKPKEKMNLHSIINGLAWRQNDLNIFNIFDLTFYQLYNGLFSTENIDNYKFTLNAVYSGNIDGKKIDLRNTHWANKFDK